MFKALKIHPYFPLGKRGYYGVTRIGNREVVGHGCNGSYVYKDDVHFPFPAIRFREPDQLYCNLKRRELCDWKQLSCAEKKTLYRYSFCQTFSEFQSPTGAWKFCLGWALVFVAVGFNLMTFYHFFVAEPWPEHLNYENQQLQLRRMLDIHVNPIDGLSSKWDYDKDDWK